MMGGAAVTVGLPFLDCFLNDNGTALAATGAPLPVLLRHLVLGLRHEPGPLGAQDSRRQITELAPELDGAGALQGPASTSISGMKVFLDGRPLITALLRRRAVLTGTTPREERVTIPSIDVLIGDASAPTRASARSKSPTTGNADPHLQPPRRQRHQPARRSRRRRSIRASSDRSSRIPNAADFTPDPR